MIKKERLLYRNGRAVFLFSVCESMSLWRQKQGIAVYFLHSGNNFITPMLIGRPGRRSLRPLHNHHFFIHSLTVKKLLPLIRQRTTRCTHSRSDKTHKSNPFLKIHSYLQFYDISKLSSLSFLIVTSLLHEFYQKSTYFYTILQLSYSHHIHTVHLRWHQKLFSHRIRNSSTSAIPG